MSSYLWCEALELVDPVGQSGQRGHHQEGAHHFLLYHHGDVSDALDGFPQSHLVSQDPIDAVLPQHLTAQRDDAGSQSVSSFNTQCFHVYK